VSREPVSWLVIEKGWRVLGRGGAELGIVDEVLGDADADIFNGLNVSSGMLSSLSYVPAERVVEIHEGEIELDLDDL
jgi:uncharacterized protein YrrD